MKNFLINCQVLFLVIGFLGGSTATGEILEGPIQNPANSHTYFLLEPDITWTQAEAEAISLGGHLVTINDAAEQAWVWSTFGEGKDRWLWVGINDVAVEGSFTWVSGEAATYRNWAPGEPNDGGTGEDYGEMDFSKGGKWNDLPNDGWIYRHYGVVEIDRADMELITLTLDNALVNECNETWTEEGVSLSIVPTAGEHCLAGSCAFEDYGGAIGLFPARLNLDLSDLGIRVTYAKVDIGDGCLGPSVAAFMYDGATTVSSAFSSTDMMDFETLTLASNGASIDRMAVSSCCEGTVYEIRLVGYYPVQPCAGDFEADGDVDGSDLALFAADFGRTDCDTGPLCEGDFDKDNDVDGSDLAVFAADFGRTDCLTP